MDNHIFEYLFKTLLHQYLGTVYPKIKTFIRICNKNAKQNWIPNLFRENDIHLFQSSINPVLSYILLTLRLNNTADFYVPGKIKVSCEYCVKKYSYNEVI